MRAVGVAHLVFGVGLGETLVCSHLYNLISHPELSHKVFIELWLCAQSVPVYHTFRIKVHLVGCAGYVVSALSVSVSVCYNPLSFLLEVEQGVAYLLHCGVSCLQYSRLYVYAFYLVVVFSLLYGRQHIVEPEVAHRVSGECSEEVLLSLLVYHAGQIEHHYGVIAHFRSAVA